LSFTAGTSALSYEDRGGRPRRDDRRDRAQRPDRLYPQQGAAYVFTEPAQGWTDMTQSAKLTASDGIEADDYGNSVSLDGETIGVGAPNQTVNGHSDQGAAYVYSEPGGAGVCVHRAGGSLVGEPDPAAELTASDGATLDYLGTSLAVSGNTVLADAQGHGNSAGALYEFT
jgi:hypothetical protein